MALQHAYVTSDVIAGLAESAITVSSGTTTNRGRLADGRADKTYSPGSVASGWNIKFDLGSAQSIAAVAILNHNLAGFSATCLIEGADDLAISVNVVTFKSATTLRASDAVLQGTSASRRHWRLTFAWTGNQTPVIGEVFASTSTALTRFTIFGNSRARAFKTIFNESDYGLIFGHFLSGPMVVRSVIWEDLTPSQKDEIFTMHSAVKGNARPFLWIEQYETGSTAADLAHQECIFGHFLEQDLAAQEADFDLYGTITLTIREQTKGVGL